MVRKSKGLTFILSFLPGLGHLYLGLNTRGLQLMAAFFASILVVPLFGSILFFIPILMPFAMAIIWFYSLFDALQQVTRMNMGRNLDELDTHQQDGNGITETADQPIFKTDWLNRHPYLIGGGLILLGALALLHSFFPGLWAWLRNTNVGTVVVAGVLIYFGVLVLRKTNSETMETKNGGDQK